MTTLPDSIVAMGIPPVEVACALAAMGLAEFDGFPGLAQWRWNRVALDELSDLGQRALFETLSRSNTRSIQ